MTLMKKITNILLWIALICCHSISAAAISIGNQQNTSISKESHKQAKQYKKEGWRTVSGADPLELQIEQAMMQQLETNGDGSPKYISVMVISDDKDYETAKLKALELAKMRLASNICSEVTGMTSSKIGNDQNEFISINSTRAYNRIGKIRPSVECWRKRSDNSFEIMMIVLYEPKSIHNE